MAAETEYDPASIKIRNYEVAYKPAPKKMANVFEMLNSAKRPLIMTGGGVILGKASALLDPIGQKISDSRYRNIDGTWFFSGNRSALAGHAGNARHLLCQYGHQPLRFASGRGREI